MTRPEIAYALLAIFALGGTLGVFLTARYKRFERAPRRGRRSAKRVRKPFWL